MTRKPAFPEWLSSQKALTSVVCVNSREQSLSTMPWMSHKVVGNNEHENDQPKIKSLLISQDYLSFIQVSNINTK